MARKPAVIEESELPTLPNITTRTTGFGLTAAAQRIDPSGSDKSRRVTLVQNWQEEAWTFFENIGEINSGMTQKQNALRRIRLVAARLDDHGIPQIIEDGNHPAWLEVNRLADSGSTGTTLCNLVLQLEVVGEGYLHVYPDENGDEICQVHSIKEVVYRGGKTIIQPDPDKRENDIEVIDGEHLLLRIWTQSAQYKNRATSPMRSVLERCYELDLLSRQVRGTARSRVAGAGLVLFPSEALTELDKNADAEGNGGFVAEFIEHMLAPIKDEGSAASTVPHIVTMPAELIKSVVHIDFARPTDATAAQQRAELITRIIQSMNYPQESITGYGDMNHWNGAIVSQQMWTVYYEPDVVAMCNSLTKEFLRLVIDDPSIVIWYDATGLVGIPDNAANATAARNAKVLGDAAYRKALGFTDFDAPLMDDFVRQLISEGKLPPDVTVPWLVSKGYLPFGTTTSAQTINAPPAAIEAPSTLVPGLAASGQRRKSVGEKLARLDYNVLLHLRDLAEQEVKRHLEIAGKAAERKMGRAAAQYKGAPMHAFCRTVGLARLRGIGFAIDQFGDFSDFFETYDELVSATQAEANALVSESMGIDSEMLTAMQERNRKIGWSRLQKQLSEIVQTAGEAPTQEIGELGLSTRYVRPGIIRETLSLAGGARPNQVGSGGGVLTPSRGGQEPVSYSGMLATGEDVVSAVIDAGGSVLNFRWEYGDQIRVRPFEPHENLDGLEVADLEDAAFANAETFPPYPYYFPGDHAGCLCQLVPVFDSEAQALPVKGDRSSMLQALRQNGGFTIDPRTGTEVTKGFAVAIPNKSSITSADAFFANPDPIVSAWLDANAELFDDPNVNVGGWFDHEHNEIVLDPSVIVRTKDAAIKLGIKNDQQAIYHLTSGVEIPTGGTGQR